MFPDLRRPDPTGGPAASRLAGLLALLVAPCLASGQTPLITVTGGAAQDFFGNSVAGTGDVNGDGVPDFVVGTQNVDIPGQDAGEVRLCSGANGSTIFVWHGSAQGHRLGETVAGGGDLNGDGVPDVLAGAPQPYLGSVYLGGQVKGYSGADGSELLTITKPGPQQLFGQSIAFAGDLNGDGKADFIVGAPFADVGAMVQAGRAEVFSGANASVLFTFNGAAANDLFGRSVAGGGDVNGDGTPDLVVGASMADLTAPNSTDGQVKVFSGVNGALLLTIDGDGICNVGYLGWAVAIPGDLNGDGRAEILAGEVGYACLAVGAGRARVFSGLDGSALFTSLGEGCWWQWGQAVSGAGDADGDGIPDFIVGSSNATVPVSTSYCNAENGRTRVYSGLTGNALLTVDGVGLEGVGSSVAGIGDLDGDGRAEILLGARYAGGGGAWQGEARVYTVPSPAATFPGLGCPGAGNFTPQISTSGTPNLGNATFAIQVSQALGGALALLALGGSNTSWNGLTLPWHLAGIGMPGCYLFVSPDLVFPVVASGTGVGVGSASVTLGVPSDPSLVGRSVYAQWWTGLSWFSVIPGALSQALQVTILP